MSRTPSDLAGKTVKTKPLVGSGLMAGDMGGRDFAVEDWFENVVGRPWMRADGNPTAIEYALRTCTNFNPYDIPTVSDDVLYGKIDGLGHAFHINELEIEGDVE